MEQMMMIVEVIKVLLVTITMLLILKFGVIGWVFLKMRQVSTVVLGSFLVCLLRCLLWALFRLQRLKTHISASWATSSFFALDQQQRDQLLKMLEEDSDE